MKLEVRNINMKSLVASSVPVVVFFVALLGGTFTFVAAINQQLNSMTLLQKIMSVGLYALMYAVVATIVIVFAAFVYNICTGALGLRGMTLDIEEINPE